MENLTNIITTIGVFTILKALQWALFILPWFSLLFIKREAIKRYMPVTVFTALLMTIVFQIAYTYDWWTIHEYILPWGYMIDVSFAYGLFAVGTFWIFYLTSNKFLTYVVTNLVMDAIFSFGVFSILEAVGIATLENITNLQYFFVIFGVSLIIYGYHKWQQEIFKQ